ncbi:MAG TPA: chemotaxis-specific protein-glutamate methyltransferase CheB [Anaerolineales bacterium]|nr:chemotaxis-specific protein-glutamate methyltransferase CheB [Anaerolineales bacterium]
MTVKDGNIRAVVVDDSPTARELLVGLFEASGIRVVGVGKNGEDAVQLVSRLRPDVISMDVMMPKMDGLEATRQIMRHFPTPIVVVTTDLMREDTDLTFEALKAGALTAVKKPGLNDTETCDEVVRTVRLMSSVKVVQRWSTDHKPHRQSPVDPAVILDERRTIKMIGIAASTGGPGILAGILKPLPKDFPIPILIVQHVTDGFASGLAQWLDSQVELPVRLAGHGDIPGPGMILMPPDDYHMQINKQGVIELSKAPHYKGLRPSANYLFYSMGRFLGPYTIGIILTGMGDDGSDGLETMHQAGALTIAQNEQSCIIYGMPREAIVRNAVDRVLNPRQISALLSQLSSKPMDR